MQLDALGDFSVVLHQIFVFVGVDHIFDGVGEIGEAHVAFTQPAPQRGEVVGVADLPVGAALGLEVDRGQHGVFIYRAGRHIGGLVDTGEARHLRPAQVQAAVVGEVVAEGDHGRPGRAVHALRRREVGIAVGVDIGIDTPRFLLIIGAGNIAPPGAVIQIIAAIRYPFRVHAPSILVMCNVKHAA